ncbi:MAG TPA: Sec-independent protein translocase subunit TatA [Jiangellaceae bacterium]|nr:Sec-independent protein translocase subunit TatA [Jiangellaceae bacterium]
MGNIGPWQLLIVAALIVLLFGARRLPELARGLGSSLRIFRAETKGMMEDDKKSTPQVGAGTAEQAQSAEPPRAAEPAPQAEPAERPGESSNRDA